MWKNVRLKPGDHIRIARYGGMYYHHGIYLGNHDVIAYQGEPFHTEDARIEIVSLAEFLQEDPIKKLEVNCTKAKYSPEEIIKRGYSRLGEREYNLFTNNCEHFALWCRNGRAKSKQVNLYLYSLLGILGGASTIPVAAYLYKKHNKDN